MASSSDVCLTKEQEALAAAPTPEASTGAKDMKAFVAVATKPCTSALSASPASVDVFLFLSPELWALLAEFPKFVSVFDSNSLDRGVIFHGAKLAQAVRISQCPEQKIEKLSVNSTLLTVPNLKLIYRNV